jgi:hypothetical protein
VISNAVGTIEEPAGTDLAGPARDRGGGHRLLARRHVPQGRARGLRDLLPIAHFNQLQGHVVVASPLLGQGHQFLAGVVGVRPADDLPHLLVEDEGVQPVRALEDEVAVVEELRRKVGLAEGLAPRLRVSSLRLGLAIACRSSSRPSFTGTEVATWSVVRRRIVFWRMK